MTPEDIQTQIEKLEKEIQEMKNNGDQELVELMEMELEELKTRLNG